MYLVLCMHVPLKCIIDLTDASFTEHVYELLSSSPMPSYITPQCEAAGFKSQGTCSDTWQMHKLFHTCL